jgi:uncharacterized membrane protein (DUF4010 family)
MDANVLSTLSLALGIGLLIGLQRERAGSAIGGIRTFPLFALLGAICGLLAAEWGGIVVVAGLIGVVTICVLVNLAKRESDATEIGGQTSEAAALLTYALGAYLATGQFAAAIVVGGVTAVLLQFKKPMHQFAGRMTERDVQAVMRFVIVTLIVLPVLPNETFGPYSVLNPREIWLMVVLIVGIGLAGYVAGKLVGQQAGVVLGGILGGLVSSTATTVAYARRVEGSKGDAVGIAALVITIASTVAVARVIVLVAVVAPAIVAAVAPPLAALLVLMIAVSVAMLFAGGKLGSKMPEQENPAELKSALVFGAVYAAIVFATAAAKAYFGDQALYGVAVVSGVVDVDAITLSTAQLAAAERIDPTTTWRVVMVAMLVNLVFKAGMSLVLGSSALFVRVALAFGISIAGGALILWAWPMLFGR